VVLLPHHRAQVHEPGAPQVPGRGLHSLTSELNLRTFGNASLTLELNLSTSGTHPRVSLGYMRDKQSGKGQSQLKLSGNGNECKPMVAGARPGAAVPHTAERRGAAGCHGAAAGVLLPRHGQGLTLVH
jgi:hypothetical protein